MNTATTIRLPSPKGAVFDTPIFYRSPAFECRRDENGSVTATIFDARRFAANFDTVLDDVFAKAMPMVEFAKKLPVHPGVKKNRNSVCMEEGDHPDILFCFWNPHSVDDPSATEARMRDIAHKLANGPTASYGQGILT